MASSRSARLLERWQTLEVHLAIWVAVAEIATLVLWVSLKGLAAYYTPGGNIVGVIFRSVLSAVVLGMAMHLAAKRSKLSEMNRRLLTVSATFVGLMAGRAWANGGVDWASNFSGWIQNASSLTLIGGPRGLVTRLTLWLALLGASMAAGRGKHINIDVATRYVPPKLTKPITVLGWGTAALVCFLATFGFIDSIAVTKYRAEAFRSCTDGAGLCDTPVSYRLGVVASGMSTDFFLLRKQMVLDLSTMPRALIGTRYDRMAAAEWNELVEDGGFRDHFPKEAVDGLILSDPSSTRMPIVVDPTTGEGRDLLIRDLNFILPFGLFIIGLKFLLRIWLVLKGDVKIEDPHAEAAPAGAAA